MKYYILIIDSGVDSEVSAPYATSVARDRAAREMVQHADFNRDYDSIFRMDIENDAPETYPFGHDELYAEEMA
jgi:hypothetical protein